MNTIDPLVIIIRKMMKLQMLEENGAV